jgi:hypothetical protein
MRKQIIPLQQPNALALGEEWLSLAEIAQVEITSEDATHPIESALLPNTGNGWRANAPGKQLIRLRFDVPQRLQRIRLRFVETAMERTQEFALRYSRDYGHTYHDIVRQQWNFSPNSSITESEEYQVDLPEVTILELTIVPNISGGDAYASLTELRLA